MGYNPFEAFKGASTNDPEFHNVSWTAAQVIIGHAMRHYQSLMAFVAVSQSRLDQKTSKKSSGFKTTITTTITGYAKPKWFIATPLELQQEGASTASYCVVSVGATDTYGSTSGCDAPEHVAGAGVAFAEWAGGNMPENEDKVYQYVQMKSAFSVLVFSIVLGLLTWGIGSAFTGMTGIWLPGGISAGMAGLIGGLAYSIASTVFGSGGSLVQAQKGFFGATGNGVLQIDLSSMSSYSQDLAQGVQNAHVSPVQGSGLSATASLYHGNCPESITSAQCGSASLDPGTMWRPDAYSEVNETLQMRDKYNDCKLMGFTGSLLETCAAPSKQSW